MSYGGRAIEESQTKDKSIINLLRSKKLDKVLILTELRKIIQRDKYNVAIVGVWSKGRLVEPREFKINPVVLLLPFIISIPPTLILHHLYFQMISGISAIIFSNIFIFFYLKNKCIIPDYITIIKTNYNDFEFLRKNKERILADPEILGTEFEVYHFKPKNLCLVKDKAANAMAYESPVGRLIVVTTGLVAKLAPEELEAALRHEEGHIKYRHMYKLMAFLISEYILRVYLLNLVYTNISFYLIGIHLLGASLLYTSLVRLYEYEADKYAASPHLARALLKIDWNNMVDEVLHPIYSRLRFLVKTHPNTLDRVVRIWTLSEISPKR